jgi:hypothetical protein
VFLWGAVLEEEAEVIIRDEDVLEYHSSAPAGELAVTLQNLASPRGISAWPIPQGSPCLAWEIRREPGLV